MLNVLYGNNSFCYRLIYCMLVYFGIHSTIEWCSVWLSKGSSSHWCNLDGIWRLYFSLSEEFYQGLLGRIVLKPDKEKKMKYPIIFRSFFI